MSGKKNDIHGNIRKESDIIKASNTFRIVSANKIESKIVFPNTSKISVRSLQKSKNRNIGRKRSSNFFNALLPSSKRTYSSSPHKQRES